VPARDGAGDDELLDLFGALDDGSALADVVGDCGVDGLIEGESGGRAS
jgi:hypothetical protein